MSGLNLMAIPDTVRRTNSGAAATKASFISLIGAEGLHLESLGE
jgi:hypothetical protein